MIGDVIGKPLDRKDGVLKVTGKAKYAAEFTPKDVVYACPVRAKVANGTISSIDTTAAKASPGVIQVFTHENAPRLTPYDQQAMARGGGGMLGETQVLPLQQNKVFYFGQYVAVVIADTFENARGAADLVKVAYSDSKPAIDLDAEIPNAPPLTQGQTNEGKASPLIASSEIKVDNVYRTPTENHHPMEPHATVAVWDGPDKLTIYDSTQGVKNCQGSTAYLFGLKPENVHVISPFVGGGFGCKGGQWPHIAIAVMSAKAVGKPVKLNVTRQMMVTNVGRRPETIQRVAIGADKGGKMIALLHHTDTYKSVSEYFERAGVPSTVLYSAPTREITYKVAKLNIGAPTFMRAPGETPGSFALESAMDELAVALNMDPIALRVLNHAPSDPLQNKPFSLENLLDCYRIGAEKFGWSKRNAKPASRREGNYLYGIGMATATYPANRSRASARIQVKQDGTAEIWCASQDIGTGTYTIMAQTASDVLGIPVEKITVNIGDSLLPQGPGSGGSQTAVSVTSAVLATAQDLKKQLVAMAVADQGSKLHGHGPEDLDAADSRLF
ncbi:MAG TPA: xanthine dehydrogenase family protein molybdopterin-binding subunit, partial [Pyrinomonadaceae bacterium]